MSTIRTNSITNSAGTGAPDFPNGLTGTVAGAVYASTNQVITGVKTFTQTINGNCANANTVTTITSAQVGAATAGLASAAVGTYGLYWVNFAYSATPGTIFSGGNLLPTNTFQSGTSYGAYSGVGSPSGSWMLMGAIGYYNSTLVSTGNNTRASVFLRIS